MILRIGVGDTMQKQDGCLNVDIRDLPNIDVVADAKKLPFKNKEHDGIESRNLIEHFGRYEIDDVLKEWARVLKKGGYMALETVDMGGLMDYWRDIPTENLLDGILGAQTYPENFHKMVFTEEILKEKLKNVGMEIVVCEKFIHRMIPRIALRAIKQ